MNIYQQVSGLMPDIRDAHTSATSAFDALHNLDNNERYVTAMQLLNNAETINGFAKQYYLNHEDIERAEFESYFEAYREFRYQFMEIVKEKETNTSWLEGKKNSLDQAMGDLESEYQILTENNEAALENQRVQKYSAEDVKRLFKAPKR